MKKIGLGILCFMFLLTGCTKSEDNNTNKNNNTNNDNNTVQETEEIKTMTCTRTATQSNLSIDVKYEVEYIGNYVSILKSTEKVISSDNSILEQYKSTLENVYGPYQEIEYYDYNITINDDTLTSVVEINYEKIDTDKMIEIDSANAQLIQNNKVKVATVKQIYESVGAICE